MTLPDFRPQPALLGQPPPPPLVAPTGSPGINSVIDVVNQTAAPFQSAPPAEHGAAGVVAQGLGGVLAVVGAPQMIIDTAFASLTAPIAALFPALPAVTLLGMHVGMPHAHMHPPSLVPPAPPVPLPSLGILVGSGAITVLLGGLPAARAGDIGLAVTCGSLAPPFEVFTGSSNVFLAGARAARVLDLTKHCNPTSMGAFGAIMGIAGVAAGAAGAVATGSGWAAAQAAADAAVLAIKMLAGKDPGIPPGMGTLIGPSVPNVLIGGFPCPPIGEMAMQGLMRALKAVARAARNYRNAKRGNAANSQGSHPIDLITGENFDHYLDFVSPGLFRWQRYCSSGRHRLDGPLGFGQRHFYQRELIVRLHQATYVDWDGQSFAFPRFARGCDTTCSNGYVLRRVKPGHYHLSYRNEPTLEFVGGPFDATYALRRVFNDDRQVVLDYDRFGRLSALTESSRHGGELTLYELVYDPHHRIVALQERPIVGGHAGRAHVRAAYAYSPKGDLVGAQDAMGGMWRYELDWFHRVVKQSDPRGYCYTFKYDTNSRCVEASGEDGLWWAKVRYFPEKRVTLYTEGDDATWEHHYDSDGFLHTLVDPYGGKLLRERDSEGKVIREIDSGGRELRFLYDSNGAASGRMDRFGYVHPPEEDQATLGNPFARSLPNTPLARFFAGRFTSSDHAAFGASGTLLQTLPPALRQRMNRVLRLASPTGSQVLQTFVRHDALGRRIHESDNLGRERSWVYDATGNLLISRDRDHKAVTQVPISWNLIGQRRTSPGRMLAYRYSKLEQVTAVIDPHGLESTYSYDRKERLIRIDRHGKVHDHYVYDGGDHLLEKRDGAGNLLFCNAIDPVSHFVAKRTLASGGEHRFAYDGRGRIVEASTHLHHVVRAFDTHGTIVAESRDGSGFERRQVNEKIHETVFFSRFLSQVEVPDIGTSVLTSADGTRTWLSFDPSGLVLRQCSNGTSELLHYDHEGRLLARLWWQASRQGQTPYWTTRYEWSAHGDLTQVIDSARKTTHYHFDDAHRLIGETTPTKQHLEYTLDDADNILAKPGLALVEVASGNRLHGDAHELFTYDHRDRLAARHARHSPAASHYVYDSFDLLVSIEATDADGHELPACHYTYDALGRRITARCGAVERSFYWDGDRLAAELLPHGAVRFYQYASTDALCPLGFTQYPTLAAEPASGRTYYVFCNPVGLPLHIENQRGDIVWWADRLDPYGAIDIRPGARLEYNLRWPGHYFDPETGLHYNRYRYYDPKLGRYLQADPLGYEGSEVNLYAYCANPLSHVDVLGLTHPNTTEGAASPRTSADNDGAEGVTPPRTGGDANAPARQNNEPLNSRNLTAAQEAHFRSRIDAANDAGDAQAAAQARYDRNCAARDNRGDPHMPPGEWLSSANRLSENSARGVRLENAALNDLGVPNNNHNSPPLTHPTPDGHTTRPDGVTDRSVIDVKSMPDTPHDDGEPRVLYDSDQLRGERAMAKQREGNHVVVLTNSNRDNVRPSGPVTKGSTVYHRDATTGQWSQWNTNKRLGPIGWKNCDRPPL